MNQGLNLFSFSSFVVCYCGRMDEVINCGSAKAKRYDISDPNNVYEGELEACDVEMFFDGPDKEKAKLLAVPEGSLTAIYVGTVFSCEQKCDRPLDCGHHLCSSTCHPGDCKSCPLLPENCLTCPCGRVPLSKLVRFLSVVYLMHSIICLVVT